MAKFVIEYIHTRGLKFNQNRQGMLISPFRLARRGYAMHGSPYLQAMQLFLKWIKVCCLQYCCIAKSCVGPYFVSADKEFQCKNVAIVKPQALDTV